MIRIIGYFISFSIFIAAAVWINNNPGYVEFNWLGYEIKPSIGMFILLTVVLVVLSIITWRIVRGVLGAPDAFGIFMSSRRRRKGYEALSKGMIAAGSGNVKLAHKFARVAESKLENEPMTLLLKAQTAQLEGDKATAQAAFETMASDQATKMLGLRGLFVEAERNEDRSSAKQIAIDAVKHDENSKWALNALFDLQCQEGDFGGALNTLLMVARLPNKDKLEVKEQRGVLLTAEAMRLKADNPDRALELGLDARNQAPDLAPATLIASELLLSKGSVRKAHKLLEKAWRLSAHPDLGKLFAQAKDGEKPAARLKRVRNFAEKAGLGNDQIVEQAKVEKAVLIARVAIELEMWADARKALEDVVANDPSARVCTLMAKIEQGELGPQSLVTEWLARAQNAPADPVWVDAGHIVSEWAPISAVTGKLGAFEWKVPDYQVMQVEAEMAANILLEHHENETQMIAEKDEVIKKLETLSVEKDAEVEQAKAETVKAKEENNNKDDDDDGASKAVIVEAEKEKKVEEKKEEVSETKLVVAEEKAEAAVETEAKEVANVEADASEKTEEVAEAQVEAAPVEKKRRFGIFKSKSSNSPFRSSDSLRTEKNGGEIKVSHRPDDPGLAGENEGVNFSPKEKIGYYSNN